MLVLPFVGLNAVALTFLVVQAFGAAAIGAFSSIPLTFFGAIALEIAANISQKYVVNVSWLSGLPESLPFIVLFGVAPAPAPPPAGLPLERRAPSGPAMAAHRLGSAWPPGCSSSAGSPWSRAWSATSWASSRIGLTQMIMLLSLGLLVKTSGQVSLCHAAFAAIGAVAFSQLTVQHGVPWFAALVLSGLIVVPVGALVAVPAIRLSGLFLALATFGFGIFVEQMLYARPWMFTDLSAGRPVPRPSLGSSDKGYYYVVLILVLITAVVMMAIHRGRLGRLLRGLSDSPVALATMGLSTNTTRVIVFCISAFFAAIAGVLYSASIHFAVSSDTYFTSFNSLVLLGLLALAPLGEPWYAVFGLVAAVVPAYLAGGNVSSWLNAFFGVSAIAVALRGGHAAMPVKLRSLLEGFGPRRPPAQSPVVAPPRRTPVGRGLEIQGLRVAFGGLVAVDNLSFSVPLGRITGLIGPNGAGKTSTFNACSGLNRPVGGRIWLGGSDITKLGASARGRLGLGRTFQRMALCDRLTVAENVALGIEAGLAGRSILGHLTASRAEQAATESATWSAMDLCGITSLAGIQAGTLSTGQRRLVELARCLAGRFDVLILDEPSSGLDRSETDAFDAILRRTIDERGCGILLVEHDMSLVMNVCDYMYVLDFGKLLFEGDPPTVAASPEVQMAYLGSGAPEMVPTARSTL